jgi:hypothetical protein
LRSVRARSTIDPAAAERERAAPTFPIPRLKPARFGSMTPDVDAIRASLRIYQAVARPVVRPDAAIPPPSIPTGEGARAGPRPIEGGAAGQSARGSPDPRTRDGPTDRARVVDATPRPIDVPDEHELWARDMKVRAEHASDSLDGELRGLQSFEYSQGPDGRIYATGDPPQLQAPADTEIAAAHDPPHGPEPPVASGPAFEAALPEPRGQDADTGVDARGEETREPIPLQSRDRPEPSKVERAYVRATQAEPGPAFDEVA